MASQLDIQGFLPDNKPNPALGNISDILNENRKYKQQLAQKAEDKGDAADRQNRMFNLKEINNLTDFDQYKTNQQALDAYSHKALKDISNNAMANYVNLDPAEMEFRLKNDMNDYVNWHSTVSDKMNEVNSNLQDFNKTYPNVDYEQAKKIANTNLIKDFIDPQTGQRQLPSNLDRNYVGELHNPDVLASIVNDTTPVEKYYASGLKPFHNSDFTSIRGVKNRNRYSGYYDPGKNSVVADANGNPTLEVNNEIVPGVTKNDEPLKIIDQNQYQNIINDPKLYPSFLKLWNNDPSAEGRQALEQHFENTTGKPMDDASKEIAFKHWLYLDAKKNLPSYINQDEAQVIPVTKNITNINNPGQAGINDVYGEIHDLAATKNGGVPLNELSATAQEILLEKANKITGEKLGQGDIFVGKDANGILSINRAENGKVISPLSYRDVNVKAQPTAKLKSAVIQQSNKQGTNTQVGTNEINLSDIPTGVKLEQKGKGWYYKGKKVKM